MLNDEVGNYFLTTTLFFFAVSMLLTNIEISSLHSFKAMLMLSLVIQLSFNIIFKQLFVSLNYFRATFIL